jgi:hypothetical protein
VLWVPDTPALVKDVEVDQVTTHERSAPKANLAQTKNSTKQMLAILETERAAHASRIRDLQDTLKAEHDAFVGRIRDLEAELEAERRAQAEQVTSISDQ